MTDPFEDALKIVLGTGKGSLFGTSTIGNGRASCTQLGLPTKTSTPPLKPDKTLIDIGRKIWEWIHGEGEEDYNGVIRIKGGKEFREKVKQDLDELAKTESGQAILRRLLEAGKKVKIVSGQINTCKPDDNNAYPVKVKESQGKIVIEKKGSGTGSTITYNPYDSPQYPDLKPPLQCRPPAIGLGHELIHALHNAEGENLTYYPDDTDPETIKPSNHEEARTIGRGAYRGEFPSENSLRKEFRNDLDYTEEKGYRILERTSHASRCPQPSRVDILYPPKTYVA